ncbi:hypothetical protein [Dokdonella sp.]|uniref:hypothetical protein n=1 Tax=Dokdonella sp. TaxID=2291710 RepID=UPI0027B9C813|nr:hypothetical protein [Dokdonella sp.]
MSRRYLLSAAVLAFTAHVQAAAPTVDPSFGWRRLFETGGGSQSEIAVAHARTADGGYVVALEVPGGGAAGGTGMRIGLFRHDADGNPVSSGFGVGGQVIKDAWLTSVTGMAIDSQGRIVVIGATPGQGGRSDFGVVRFNPDGSDDTSFAGDGGTAVGFDHSGLNTDDNPTSVLIDAADKIVVAGDWHATGTEAQFCALRLNVDGSIDNTWGSISDGAGGKRGTCDGFAAGKDAHARRILRIDRGYYVVAGTSSFSSTDTDFAARILTPSGSQWAGYVGSRTFPIDMPAADDSLFDTLTDAVLVDSTTILLVGTSSDRLAATRIKAGAENNSSQYSTLQTDPSFIGGGPASFSHTFVDATPSAMAGSAAIAPNGQMMLVGSTTHMPIGLSTDAHEPQGSAPPMHGLLVQLNANGTIDGGFGDGGNATIDVPSGNSSAYYTWISQVSFAGSRPVLLGTSSFSIVPVTDLDGILTRLRSDLIFADGFQVQY